VDIIGDYLYAIGVSMGRKSRRVYYPAAIRTDVGTLLARALVPKVVFVYIAIADFLQTGLL
jgi:hypothetical protein